jgi:hypothetical protein
MDNNIDFVNYEIFLFVYLPVLIMYPYIMISIHKIKL